MSNSLPVYGQRGRKSLNLGIVDDFYVAKAITSAIRSIALQISNPDLIDYALRLNREFVEWEKREEEEIAEKEKKEEDAQKAQADAASQAGYR